MGGAQTKNALARNRNTTTAILWFTLLDSKKITDMLILRAGSVSAILVASEKFYQLIYPEFKIFIKQD